MCKLHWQIFSCWRRHQNGWSSDEDKTNKNDEDVYHDNNDESNNEDIFDGSNGGGDEIWVDNEYSNNQGYVGHSNSGQNRKGALMIAQAFRSALLV